AVSSTEPGSNRVPNSKRRLNDPETAEVHLQFTVAVECAAIDRERLHPGVGKRGDVYLAAGDSLDVHGEYALVREHHLISGSLRRNDRGLSVDVQRQESRLDRCRSTSR